MTDNMVLLDQPNDTLVDLFCGAGGSGSGLLEACDLLKHSVRGHFVNHWDRAIDIHTANHPEHAHYKEDLFLLDPAQILPAETSVSLLWGSPSCTFFSLARGSACVTDQGRSHVNSVTDWVKHLKPDGIIIENVKEFLSYGPVIQKRDDAGELVWRKESVRCADCDREPVESEERRAACDRAPGESEERWIARKLDEGYLPFEIPDKSRKGEYFDAWIAEMDDLGYDSEWRLLCSADYGDPTIRKRLFIYLVRRGSGKRIVWPLPTHGKPDKDGKVAGGLQPWRTARQIIDWTKKGESVFARKKKLAPNTFRRLAIGLVKYGLSEFLLPSHKCFSEDNVRGLDVPMTTLTTKSRAEGLVQPAAYMIPKDQGWDKSNVRGVDEPVSTLTARHDGEGLAQPCIIQMKGQSTAQGIDTPLTAVTAQPSHYVLEPLLDNLYGDGRATDTNRPVGAITAGGQHVALAEAFMMAIDQTGGGRNHGTYSVEEPVRTLVTKANASCIEFELVALEDNFRTLSAAMGDDASRAETFLGYLVDELKKKGKLDAKPWIYVYYSSGSEGAHIDSPLPTVRTKSGHAICYPVIEFDGIKLRIDLFYRMLAPVELQRAMGFPDDMKWAGANQEEKIRAIGNSVSRGVSRALGLAWYGQDENIQQHINK